MPDIFSKFTTHYQKILTRAQAQATQAGRTLLDVADLLIGLAAERGSLASEILERHSLTILSIHEKLGLIPQKITTPGDLKRLLDEDSFIDLLSTSVSPLAQNIIERSVLVAWQHQHHYIGTEHLLYALATSDEPEMQELWKKLDVEVKSLRANVSAVLKSTSKFPDLTEAFSSSDNEPSASTKEASKKAATPTLEFFANDLTSRDNQNKIDPVIGREREIERLVNILARRTKNNPLLLGDPGVGKTAIVEGLAKRIVQGQVPDFLQNKKIYALDLGLVVAGTMYRGEFEGRLKQILEELRAHPEIILFIDEIHTIVGTGAAPGSLDLANLIKPALAKGLIRCIGATTQEEYKKSIESDAALERRFQVVQVKEPSPEETTAVLKGVRGSYEKFHRVKINDEAIEAAVQMSERYLPDKFLPDKAIDLLDEAASHLKTSGLPSVNYKKERVLEERISQLREAKELAIKEENFPLATAYKEEEKKTVQELEAIRNHRGTASDEVVGEVTRQQIAQVVAHITGVPMTELMAEEREKLTKLEELLSARVVGQDEAIARVTKAIRRSRLGLGNPNRPLGSFIFLGPSGVGKTELAKAIAEIVFNDPQALVRLDMSEFSEAFNISKLIGAPAGYVGYKDANKLSDLIKRRPAAVVLFDEIEKAHKDVFNLLLQVLEDGHITDASGKQINFKNTLVIMTSNLGLQKLKNQAKLGFQAESTLDVKKFNEEYNETKEQLLGEVKKFFQPEFLNRLDGTLVFNPLTEANLEQIVALQVTEFNNRLKTQKLPLTLVVTRGAAQAIAKATFSPDEGARGIRRYLQDHVEDPLTHKLLHNQLKLPTKLRIKANKDGTIYLE